MNHGRWVLAGSIGGVLVIGLIALNIGGKQATETAETDPASVLSVVLTRAERSMLPTCVPASGNVFAWQDASIGAEADGLRLTDVLVNVGDTVERGQVLARFDADIVESALAEAKAAVAQAQAEAQEAEVNARRARSLEGSGAMSGQQVSQFVSGALTAQARLDAARAVENRQRLHLAQTQVRAPSDGIITSRTATVGGVVSAGEELFRLIRDGRLEWRAAVAAEDMEKLVLGQTAILLVRGRQPIRGTLRMVSPTIDTQTHDGLVYADLPRDGALRAGAFARGYFEIGEERVLTLPQDAVLLRDGFHYVMRVGPASNVMLAKVDVGRRVEDRVEIVAGLAASDPVIASGLAFLSEGDRVRVVDEAGAGQVDEYAAAVEAPSDVETPARSAR